MGIQDIDTHEIQNYLDELEQCRTELDDIINRSQKAFSSIYNGFLSPEQAVIKNRHNAVKDDLLNCNKHFKGLQNYIREKYGLRCLP